MISSNAVLIPKYLVPILAATLRNIVTERIETKINVQEVISNNFNRFQIGATLAGYLEYQFSGR